MRAIQSGATGSHIILLALNLRLVVGGDEERVDAAVVGVAYIQVVRLELTINGDDKDVHVFPSPSQRP